MSAEITQVTKKFVQGWADVAEDQIKIEALAGGASGQGVFKVSAAGADPPLDLI